MGGGYSIPAADIITQFIPIYVSANWFVGCYLMMYIMHPALNVFLKRGSKTTIILIISVFAFVFCGLQFIKPTSLNYSNLLGFMLIYLIVGYIKLFSDIDKAKRKAKWNGMIAAIANILLVIVTNIVGLYVPLVGNQLMRYNYFINPFLVIIAICLLLVFDDVKIGKGSAISFISGMTLTIYIIHNNKLIMDYVLPDAFKRIYETYGFNYELIWVVCAALILALSSLLLSVIYKFTLQKLTYRIFDFVYLISRRVYYSFVRACSVSLK